MNSMNLYRIVIGTCLQKPQAHTCSQSGDCSRLIKLIYMNKGEEIHMTLEFKDIYIDKEFEDLLPKLTMDEFEKLEKNIIKNGVLDPLMIWRDSETDKYVLIDGHNRYRIIEKNNLEFNIWHGFKIFYEEELPTREAVKEWMLEQQLGRRNLTEIERYEIVQKFKELIQNKAKKNQSLGGKGLPNLVKVNVQEEMAKATGVSKGSYHKLDKVMQSDNGEVKQQLKQKKISIDGAYKTINNPVPKKKEELTPQIQIEKFDDRMNEIDNEVSVLRMEREDLMRRRTSLFEALDIECELKYEFVETDSLGFSRDCRFFIEIDGHMEIFIESGVYIDEVPFSLYINKVPEKYKNDFIMLWKKAHLEELERINRYNAERDKEFERMDKTRIVTEENKSFYKKCFHLLAKNFHPDNEDGSIEDMQCLNELKIMWGI